MTPPSPPQVPADAAAAPDTCARCGKTLTESDRADAGDRAFCRSCFESLRLELAQAVDAQSADVPYPMAVLGALLGGALGVLVWWGFTVLTKIGFGLIAVAIGFLVGHGVLRFSGHKRSVPLQAIAVVVSLASFLVASYLVNRTFINQQLASSGDSGRVPFPPTSLEMFVAVVGAGFGIMDVVFMAITVWQAWSITRPMTLPDAPHS